MKPLPFLRSPSVVVLMTSRSKNRILQIFVEHMPIFKFPPNCYECAFVSSFVCLFVLSFFVSVFVFVLFLLFALFCFSYYFLLFCFNVLGNYERKRLLEDTQEFSSE